jgi:hypothetical protein
MEFYFSVYLVQLKVECESLGVRCDECGVDQFGVNCSLLAYHRVPTEALKLHWGNVDVLEQQQYM